MKKNPKISIIILDNFHPNIVKFLPTIKSLTNQDYNDYEIILVLYNKSGEMVIHNILKSNNINTNKIKIFSSSKNLGYAGGNNLGAKKANGELLLIINPDIETSKDFLSNLVKTFNYLSKFNKSDKIIIGPRLCNYDGIIEYSRRNINFLGFSNMDISKTDKIRRTRISTGCALMMRREYFESLNGFDESYFMYQEDIDFSIKAALQGFKQYIDNSIHIYHLRSDKEYRFTAFKYYYHERNRILMSMEHSKKKFKMILSHLLYEPFHIAFALMRGFLKQRMKIYYFFITNFRNIVTKSNKENDYFDQYWGMEGIFNEVQAGSLVYKFLNYYSKILFYFYKS